MNLSFLINNINSSKENERTSTLHASHTTWGMKDLSQLKGKEMELRKEANFAKAWAT